jgi:uncharacterized membrane protein HdeD (DUF308 family)
VGAWLYPFTTAITIGFFFGWMLSLAGILGMVATMRRPEGSRHWMDLGTGAITLVSGLFLLLDPVLLSLAVAWTIALWLGTLGIVEFVAAWRSKRQRPPLFALATCDILFAVLFLAGIPGPDIAILAVLVAMALIGSGTVKVWISLRLRKIAHEAAPSPVSRSWDAVARIFAGSRSLRAQSHPSNAKQGITK